MNFINSVVFQKNIGHKFSFCYLSIETIVKQLPSTSSIIKISGATMTMDIVVSDTLYLNLLDITLL